MQDHGTRKGWECTNAYGIVRIRVSDTKVVVIFHPDKPDQNTQTHTIVLGRGPVIRRKSKPYDPSKQMGGED